MKTLFNRFVNDEYGLIAALLAVVIIGSLQLVGTELTATFTKVSTELGKATP